MDNRGGTVGLTIIAGTPPGGGQDRTARAMASVLPGQTEVINVPGRGGGNAWDLLAARPGETDIVAVSSPTLLTNRLLGDSRIDDRDLSPIAVLYTEYSLLVAPALSKWLSPEDLLFGFSHGEVTVSFATALGSVNHLVLVELGRQLGLTPGEIPIRVFDSAHIAIGDLLEGNADVALVSAVSAAPEIGDGRLHPVAVVAPGRLGGALSAVPAVGELGLMCDLGMWRGLVGPPEVEPSSIEGWGDRLRSARATRVWGDLLVNNHWSDTFIGPSSIAAFLDEQRSALAGPLELSREQPMVESG